MTVRITKAGILVEYVDDNFVNIIKAGILAEYVDNNFASIIKAGILVEYTFDPMTYGPRIQAL